MPDPEEPDSTDADHTRAERPERPRPSRRKATLVVAPIVVLVAMSYAGDALTTSWAEDHPLALIALNSRNRILVLASNQLDPVSYYVVAGLRLLLSDPLFFILGMWYGDAAIRWVESKSSTYGQQLRWFESGFSRAAYPLVFLAPNNIICLLAGASGMPLPGFIVANVAGTFTRLFLLRRAGEAFEAPIDDVLGFFRDYRLPLFIVSLGLVAVVVWSDRRKGRTDVDIVTEIESMDDGQ